MVSAQCINRFLRRYKRRKLSCEWIVGTVVGIRLFVCQSEGVWSPGWRPCCGQQGAACSTCLSLSVPTSSPIGPCGWPAATAGTCRCSHTGEAVYLSPSSPVCPLTRLSVWSSAGVHQILSVRRFSGLWVLDAGASPACRWRLLIPG